MSVLLASGRLYLSSLDCSGSCNQCYGLVVHGAAHWIVHLHVGSSAPLFSIRVMGLRALAAPKVVMAC